MLRLNLHSPIWPTIAGDASSIRPAPSIAWTATHTTTAKPMSRIPASLLYLTVYNPTLKPTGPIPDGDEDAEEQAQILFYTSKERAVSRDRMLRQVGLAKALVNFTEMFNPSGEPCENVHSQSRRMVMISPEPGFWIHACVELPKTPRQPTKSPSKSKKSEPVKQEPLFDYHEGLVHDIALKAHLQRAYELFKIRHGSFTSILENLGQQALELQLERFFTVWAWSWDTEEQPDFCLHLGRPLHPYFKTLTSQFEPLDDVLPTGSIPFALSPSGLIPSPRFSEFSPSPALVQHLRSILPEYVPSDPDLSPNSESDPNTVKASASNENSGQQPTAGFSLPAIPMPAVTLNVDMRNLRWSWPGYLTFGKNTKDKEKRKSTKVPADEQKPDSKLEPKPDTGTEGGTPSDAPVVEGENPSSDPPKEEEKVEVEVEVDTGSLADAMEENRHGGSSSQHSPGAGTPSESPPQPAVGTDGPPPDDDTTPAAVQSVDPVPVFPEVDGVSQEPASTMPPSPSPVEEPLPIISEPPPPPVTLAQSLVHLAPPGHPLRTTKRKLYYLTKGDITVAVADDESSSLQLQEDLHSVVQAALKVIENLRATILDEERRSANGTPVTAAKILQPKDTHVFSVERDYTVTGEGGFKSNSEYLYSGQQLLESDQDIAEVFSRDSNPQHWHIARQGNGLDSEGRTTQNTVFYHSARKESSLADVDNAIAAVVRKFVKSVSRANTIIAPRPEAHNLEYH